MLRINKNNFLFTMHLRTKKLYDGTCHFLQFIKGYLVFIIQEMAFER